MRQCFLRIISLLSVLFLTLSSTLSRSDAAEAFTIEQFQVDIELSKEEEIVVTEDIQLTFTEPRHGIIRSIPVTYNESEYNNLAKSDIEIEILDVVDTEGKSWEYESYTEGDYFKVKIGDPDVTVNGAVRYIIKYKAQFAIDFYQSHDELYWNATGNEWDTEIRAAKVRVFIPFEGIDAKDIQSRCFTGAYQESDESCSIRKAQQVNGGYQLEFESESKLAAFEGISVVVGVPKGYIEEPSFWDRYLKLILVNLGLCCPLPVFIGMFAYWSKYGRDPKGRGSVMPEFNPPAGLSPAEAGAVYDNTVDNIDLSATIIDLAIRGYIQIIEVEGSGIFKKGDYRFILKKDDLSSLKKHEEQILSGLFDGTIVTGAETLLSEHNTKFYATTQKIQKELYEQITASGHYSRNPAQAKAATISVGVMLIVLTIFFGAKTFIPAGGIGTAIGIMLSGAIIIIFGIFMPQRSEKGVEAYESLKGLKMYIDTAEKDRLDKMQAPDSEYAKSHDPALRGKMVELFEKLLPYAIVMKVEQKWGARFADIYKQPPDWYSSSSWQTFNTIHLINSLSSATNRINSTLVSSPRSSGSGFSGGGFSGGGSGGGGGSSW